MRSEREDVLPEGPRVWQQDNAGGVGQQFGLALEAPRRSILRKHQGCRSMLASGRLHQMSVPTDSVLFQEIRDRLRDENDVEMMSSEAAEWRAAPQTVVNLKTDRSSRGHGGDNVSRSSAQDAEEPGMEWQRNIFAVQEDFPKMERVEDERSQTINIRANLIAFSAAVLEFAKQISSCLARIGRPDIRW